MRAGRVAKAGVPVLSALGINAVPVSGLVFGGWAPETTLVVYIVETLLLVLVTALRLRLFAPLQLVTANGATQSRGETIQGFVLVTGGLILAGAVFSAFFLWRAVDLAATQHALMISLPVFAAFQGMGLLADLVFMRQPSQAVIERWMLPGLRRGCVLYGAVVFGTLGAVSGLTFFVYPFIALKVLFDIGGAIEEGMARLRGVVPPSPGILDVSLTLSESSDIRDRL